MDPKGRKFRKFSLAEVTATLFLTGIMIVVIFIQINPTVTFPGTRDAQRRFDVNQILNAVSQFITEPGNSFDNLGEIPDCSLGKSEIGTKNLNLKASLVPTYTLQIPFDPLNGSEEETGYSICLLAQRIEVSALHPEKDPEIKVYR